MLENHHQTVFTGAGLSECARPYQALARFVQACGAYKPRVFKEGEKSITRAFHVPYSGWGNPDYLDFFDHVERDARNLIVSLVEERQRGGAAPVGNLQELQAAWEDIDDDGQLHDEVESSLTWQQGLRECAIILENAEHEETDSGLWQGLPPLEAIRIMAFFTYKAEVFAKGQALIEDAIKREAW